MEKKLQVKDLRISFRTSNGKVEAVRDISFDLAKGEPLAIRLRQVRYLQGYPGYPGWQLHH